MDNQKLSLNVTTADGRVTIGGSFSELKDETKGTFNTNSVDDFISYLIGEGREGTRVFYNESSCVAMQGTRVFYNESSCVAMLGLNVCKNSVPVATCSIQTTQILNLLKDIENESMTLADFDEFVRTVKNFLRGGDALKLLDFVDNVNLSKVKTITRQKDHQGNYNYATSSVSGNNDYQFPKTLKFSIPVIKNLDKEMEIVFDFYFTWTEKMDGPELKFKLRNIHLDDMIEKWINGTVCELLLKNGVWAKFGSYKITQMDDSWKYFANPLQVKGL